MPGLNAEILFWSAIMENHTEFMLDALSFREQELIAKAEYFRDAWSAVHAGGEKAPGSDAGPVYVDYVLCLLKEFIDLKRLILQRLLTCSIEINLPPSFLNHMINEAEEFEKVLSPTLLIYDPARQVMELHIVWLTDAAGHAATIAADLDPSESLYVHQAHAFQQDFTELRDKALELSKMVGRTGLRDGSIAHLTAQVEHVMNGFIRFLEMMRTLRHQCSVLGIFKPLVPDHMLREESYYLAKVKSIQIG